MKLILLRDLAQNETQMTNKSFEEILDKYYEQEHSDCVMCAKEDYDGLISRARCKAPILTFLPFLSSFPNPQSLSSVIFLFFPAKMSIL